MIDFYFLLIAVLFSQMIVKEPLKTQIKQPESPLNGKNKSQAQILDGGDHFSKCRIFSIAILVIFVKNQSILRK
jgi:hypothetical protein